MAKKIQAEAEVPDIQPQEVEETPAADTPAETIAPDIEPEVEGVDVAPLDVPEVSAMRRSVSMSDIGGSVAETLFRTQ